MSDPSDGSNAIPPFITPNKIPPPFYFHHIINPEKTTLTIQVIGPNLEFQFSHRRAAMLMSPGAIAKQLDRKTAGFLALAQPSGERVVLAAAESGHGRGRFGDLLDAGPGVLSNKLWTRRVVAVSRLIGVSLRGPFDNFLGSSGDTEGVFQGCHVEVKLAVHGVFVLLGYFGITRDFDSVGLHHLRRLRGAAWEDGSRPVLEVYFSRKNCARCGCLVRKLSEATGIPIHLIWRHRVQLKQYPKANLKPAAPPNGDDGASRDRRRQMVESIDDQDMDFGDGLVEAVNQEDADDNDDGSVQLIETIDLMSNPAITISPTPGPWLTVDPPDAHHPADDFLDGLAYRVGQLESSPAGATEAIVQFAQQMRGDRIRWLGTEVAASNSSSSSSINKPLPATPKTEPPAWMRAAAGANGNGSGAAAVTGGRNSSGGETTTSISRRGRRRSWLRETFSPDVDFEFPNRLESASPCVRAAIRERLSGLYSTGSLE